MRSTTVVFRGKAQVIEAYMANEVGPWAIKSGNNILAAENAQTVEEGEPVLREMLERLQRGGSRACFDFCVYKVSAEQEIDPSTKVFRGFRFALYGEEELSPYDYHERSSREKYEARYAALEQEIIELKKTLAEKESEEEDQEEVMSLKGIISGIVEIPQVKAALGMFISNLVGKVIPMSAQPGTQRAAAIAGIEGQSLLDPEQQGKVQEAVNILCTKDAQLGDHLLAIANIALQDPARFNFLVGMLK